MLTAFSLRGLAGQKLQLSLHSSTGDSSGSSMVVELASSMLVERRLAATVRAIALSSEGFEVAVGACLRRLRVLHHP